MTGPLEQVLRNLEQLSPEEFDVLLEHALKLRASRNVSHQVEKGILPDSGAEAKPD